MIISFKLYGILHTISALKSYTYIQICDFKPYNFLKLKNTNMRIGIYRKKTTNYSGYKQRKTELPDSTKHLTRVFTGNIPKKWRLIRV